METFFGHMFMLSWAWVGLLGTAFWIWMLVDCAKNEPRKGNDRIVWILIITITHLVGALIYYFARRPERIREQAE